MRRLIANVCYFIVGAVAGIALAMLINCGRFQ